MATFRHPETGVILNRIVMRRANLSQIEAETARSLRQSGMLIHDIAAMLGTNSGRVSTAVGTGRPMDPRQMTLL